MHTPSRSTLNIALCLLLVYLAWGSTFICIKLGLESFPPFLLCGVRMTCGGFLLYALTWLQGERTRPTRTDLKQASILALLMVLVSSGFLCKGQESVPSGTAAMILGTVPLWMVLGGWLWFGEPRPGLRQCIGLGMGTAGLFCLAMHQGLTGVTSFGALAMVVLAALGWVAGSFYSKKHATETRLSLMRNSGLLVFLGGVQSLAVGFALGERFTASISAQSATAMAFLIVFGAVIAYSCYFWLLLHTRMAVAISYEYVNPVIGVFLGWKLGGEQVDAMIVLACLAVVTSVFFMISGRE